MTREKYNNGLECLLRSHLRSRLHHPVNRLSSPDRPARRIRFHESVTEATQFVSYEKTPKKKNTNWMQRYVRDIRFCCNHV